MGWKNVLFLIVVLTLFSCSGNQMTLDPAKQSDSELYQRGVKELQEENCQKARDAFKVVFENFPKSDYRILAKLGIADSHFCEDNGAGYILAIQEYQDFISLFPFSPKACYAQLRIGMSYYEMVEKPDRDQTNTRKSLEEFRKVVDNYPNCEHYREAYDRLLSCYSRLAEHEFLIARYYQNTGKHQAAVDRMKGLMKAYPESVYEPKFYFYLALSLEKLEQYNESCVYYDSLLSKWPTSEFTQQAQEAKARGCK